MSPINTKHSCFIKELSFAITMIVVLLSLALSGSVLAQPHSEQPTLRADFRHRPPQMVISDGQFSGPLKDIIEEATNTAGYQIKWREVPFKRSLLQAISGDTDLIPRVSYQPERAQFINYSDPIGYRLKTTLFLVRKNQRSKVKTYEDLYQFSQIGTKLGTAYFERFDKDTKIQRYGSLEDANMSKMFIHNRFPAMAVVDKEAIVEALAKHQFTDYAFARYQHHERLGIFYGFSKSSPMRDAFEPINTALKQMVQSGRVHQVYESYGIDDPILYMPLPKKN